MQVDDDRINDRAELFASLAGEPPVSGSSRALAFVASFNDYLAGEIAGMITNTEAHLAVALPPHSRARVADHFFKQNTAEAVSGLRSLNLYCPN